MIRHTLYSTRTDTIFPSTSLCRSALPDGAVELGYADTRLFRHDLENGTTETRDFGPGRHPGEFVFVPRSPEGAEDDGWLVGLVVNMNDETTDLDRKSTRLNSSH